MKGYELLEQIAKKEIIDNTKFWCKNNNEIYMLSNRNFIHVKYGGVNIVAILNYDFEVIEENKEIEELKEWTQYRDEENYDYRDIEINRKKINELVRAYNKLIKERE